jgi:hypothetical protein
MAELVVEKYNHDEEIDSSYLFVNAASVLEKSFYNRDKLVEVYSWLC